MQDKLKKAFSKLDNYINQWLIDNNFNCKAYNSTDFESDIESNSIYYTVFITEEYDKYYFPFIQIYTEDIISCDPFILSFFHELGHIVTKDQFTETDYEKYFDYVNNLYGEKEELSKWDYFKYYFHPIEVAATEWSINYILNNQEKVKNFLNSLSSIVLEIFKELDIDIQE